MDVALILLLVVVASFVLWMATDGLKVNRLGIVILGTSFTNGQQFVTFRPDPPGAEIMWAELVDVSNDGGTQPQTIERFGQIHPIRDLGETNVTLHFVALPVRGAITAGRPCAYTPGSYTVAYTPTENAHRVRIGVAPRQPGISGYARWLRGCWESESFTPPWRKGYGGAHGDTTYVTTAPFTNEVWTTP